MSKKYLFIVLIIILGFLFYWFQIRPSQIKAECAQTTSEAINTTRDSDVDWFKWQKPFYEHCLHKKGL